MLIFSITIQKKTIYTKNKCQNINFCTNSLYPFLSFIVLFTNRFRNFFLIFHNARFITIIPINSVL